MKNVKRLLLGAGLAAMVAGCGNTVVLDTWKDTTVKPSPAKRIVVVGLSGDEITRRLFEDTFSEQLRKRNNDAVAGHTVLPPNLEANADSVLTAIKAKGFDAVLTARSMGVQEEETVVSGAAYYVPDTGYYGFGGYYGGVTSTTYTTRTEKARVETHLYQTSTAKLVWGARSETTSTGKLTEGMRDYARTVVSDLAKSGFIK